jgi:hypothetical protein
MTRNSFVSLSIILLLIIFVGCESDTNPSETNIDSSIINNNNKDGIWVGLGLTEEEWKEMQEERSSDSILGVNCIRQKEIVSKVTNLFSQHYIDSNLIVLMSKIKCNKINFKRTQKSPYNVKKWNFDYKQLMKFKDDKRTCPKVLIYKDYIYSDVLEIDSIHLSTVSTEALRFLNSKVLGYYPCEIRYTYKQIASKYSLHPEKWDIKNR